MSRTPLLIANAAAAFAMVAAAWFALNAVELARRGPGPVSLGAIAPERPPLPPRPTARTVDAAPGGAARALVFGDRPVDAALAAMALSEADPSAEGARLKPLSSAAAAAEMSAAAAELAPAPEVDEALAETAAAPSPAAEASTAAEDSTAAEASTAAEEEPAQTGPAPELDATATAEGPDLPPPPPPRPARSAAAVDGAAAAEASAAQAGEPATDAPAADERPSPPGTEAADADADAQEAFPGLPQTTPPAPPRRPGVAAAPAPAAPAPVSDVDLAVAEAATTRAPDGLPSVDGMFLISVLTSAQGDRALLRSPLRGVVTVRQGDEVDGWRVASIDVNSVGLSRDGETRVLELPSSGTTP